MSNAANWDCYTARSDTKISNLASGETRVVFAWCRGDPSNRGPIGSGYEVWIVQVGGKEFTEPSQPDYSAGCRPANACFEADSIRAHALFLRAVDYLGETGAIESVDESKGRIIRHCRDAV